jgi:hypothetical protein
MTHPFNRCGILALAAALAVAVYALSSCPVASAAEDTGGAGPKPQWPRPDGKPADMTKPVKVFILMGQSNMVGLGNVAGGEGSLENAVKAKKKYPYLVDDAGNWSERKDVRNVRVMVGKGGGMEHAECTVMMAAPNATRRRDTYVAWLSLVAHELFHAWNVKRLRPREIVPGEYEVEQYTRSLGIAEGFTSYYAYLAMRRAGVTSRW